MKPFILLPLVVAITTALTACNSSSGNGKKAWMETTNSTSPTPTPAIPGTTPSTPTPTPTTGTTPATPSNPGPTPAPVPTPTTPVPTTPVPTTPGTTTPSPTTPPPTTPTPTGVTQTGQYRLDPIPANMAAELTQINNLAQQGYALLGPTESGNLSYKPNDRNMQLEYKTVTGNTNSVDVLNQMGQDGWLFKGPNMDGTMAAYDLYFKDKANPKTYQYQGFPINFNIVTQANNAGANGWRFFGQFGANADQSTHFNLYVKDNTSPKYEYIGDSAGNSIAALREQILNRAKEGWAYRGTISLTGSAYNPTFVELFERPVGTNTAVTCEVVDVLDGSTHLSQMNDYASKGFLFLGTQAVTSGTGTAMTVSYGDVYCKGMSNMWTNFLTGPLLPQV